MAEPAKPTPPQAPTPPAPPAGDAQGYEQFGRLISVIGADPKYHDRLLEIVGEAVPDSERIFPEIAWRKRLTSALEDTKKGQAEREQKAEQRLGAIEQLLGRQRFAAEHSLSDDDLTEVEQMAKDGRIGDPKTAVDYWRMSQLGKPRATPGPTPGLTEQDKKELYKDRKGWFDRVAPMVLEQERRRQRRGA